MADLDLYDSLESERDWQRYVEHYRHEDDDLEEIIIDEDF